MVEKRRGLGRGLGALIPSGPGEDPVEDSPESPVLKQMPPGEPGNSPRPADLFFTSNRVDKVREARKSGRQSSSLASPDRALNASDGAINKDASNGQQKRAAAVKSPDAKKNVSRAHDTAPQRVSGSRDGGANDGGPQEDPAEASSSLEPASRLVPGDGPVAGDSIGVGSPASAFGGSTSSESVSRETLLAVPGAQFAELPIDSIHANRKQPRTVFDEEDMAELVHSVREIGILQPIVVRPSPEDGDHRYELVMGERRWRAARAAGLRFVPAIIRSTTDDALLRDALLENLHRSSLNPLEEAAAYQQLLEDFGCSQEELAERIGRSRPQISNTLRLMKLPALVQRRVGAGIISAGHARALLGLSDPAEMEKLAQRIVAEGLSVRSTEEAVALSDGLRRPVKANPPRPGARHERLDYLATSLADRLDTSVKITLGARKGKVSIEFASVDDLNRIMAVISPPEVE